MQETSVVITLHKEISRKEKFDRVRKQFKKKIGILSLHIRKKIGKKVIAAVYIRISQ